MLSTVQAKNLTVTLLALLVLGTGALLWLTPAVSQRAPDVSLTTLHGRKLNIASLHGHPVLVNFWATTCRGCIDELRQLTELYKEFGPQGLEVIGIAMSYDPPNRVVAVSEARRVPYPIALDLHSDVARAFGDVEVTPTSLLIAPDGKVVQRNSGPLDMPEVRAIIAGMLSPARDGTQRLPVN